jgi:hypothetical protein
MTDTDDTLAARQAALHEAAGSLWAEFEPLLNGFGQVQLAGSYVSGLMAWPDLDVMVHVGPNFTPADVLDLAHRLIKLPGVHGLDYQDERGARSPTHTVRDERYHLVVSLDRADRTWRLDLTLWLNDPHANITEWHESLRDTISAAQRAAVLRIKDVWHRRPEYPDQVGGWEIYRAVLDNGVRDAADFAIWLAAHGGSQPAPGRSGEGPQ